MPKKIYPTQEMLDDLLKMGDVDFCKKWGVSKRIPIRLRKDFSIKSFTPQHGTKIKIVDGVEYKWCPKGHWEILSEFRVVLSRPRGVAGLCKKHEREDAVAYYHKGGKELNQKWRESENGKKYLRNTWRKKTAKRKEVLVKWNRNDEERIYNVFGGRCAYCADSVSFLEIEFDHIIPVSRGGKTEPLNMVPCCKNCNHGENGKFNRDVVEWLTSRFGETRAILIYRDIKKKMSISDEN